MNEVTSSTVQYPHRAMESEYLLFLIDSSRSDAEETIWIGMTHTLCGVGPSLAAFGML